MSNNIIVLSSDDEGSEDGDNLVDPWLLYSSKSNKYVEENNSVQSTVFKDDPFQIGARYTTPSIVTPFKTPTTQYGIFPIGVMGSVREGLKPTSPTANPYKKSIIHGEECHRTTSLMREGYNTTSPIVIQKWYVLKEVMKHNSGEGFTTNSSNFSKSDNHRFGEKEGHSATSSTKTQMKEGSKTVSFINSPHGIINNDKIIGESFFHSSLINILPDEKPRDAYLRYVEAYHNIP